MERINPCKRELYFYPSTTLGSLEIFFVSPTLVSHTNIYRRHSMQRKGPIQSFIICNGHCLCLLSAAATLPLADNLQWKQTLTVLLKYQVQWHLVFLRKHHFNVCNLDFSDISVYFCSTVLCLPKILQLVYFSQVQCDYALSQFYKHDFFQYVLLR